MTEPIRAAFEYIASHDLEKSIIYYFCTRDPKFNPQNPQSEVSRTCRRNHERKFRKWKEKLRNAVRLAPSKRQLQLLSDAFGSLGITPEQLKSWGLPVANCLFLTDKMIRLPPSSNIVDVELDCLNSVHIVSEIDNQPEIWKRLRKIFLRENRHRLCRVYCGAKSYQANHHNYVRRTIDDHIEAFLKGSDQHWIVASDSGLGKTAALLFQANQQFQAGVPVLFINGANLEPVESASEPIGQRMLFNALAKQDFFTSVDNVAEQQLEWTKLVGSIAGTSRNRKLLIVLDAIDRFNGSLDQLQHSIQSILYWLRNYSMGESTPRVQVILSCRRDVWQEYFRVEVQSRECRLLRLPEPFGGRPGDGFANGFDDASIEQVVARYCKLYRVTLNGFSTSQLSSNLQLRRNPLLMRLFFESHQHQTISSTSVPRLWHMYLRFMDRKRGELASRWAQELGIVYDHLKDVDKQSIHKLVTALVLKVSLLMLELRCTECRRQDVEQYLTDWMKGPSTHEPLLHFPVPAIPSPFQTIDPVRLVHTFIKSSLASELIVGSGSNAGVRFDLDWYYEFCLGRALGECCAANPTKITAILNSLENRLQHESRYILKALKYAILHAEFEYDSDLYLDILARLGAMPYPFQEIACEAMRSLGLVQLNPGSTPNHDSNITNKSKRFSRWSAEASKANEFLPIEVRKVLHVVDIIVDKGDFVCRFILRELLATLRSKFRAVIDSYLRHRFDSVKFEAPSHHVGANCRILSWIMAIDVLQSGDFADAEFLTQLLTYDPVDEDPNLKFWRLRFAALALYSILLQNRNHLDEAQWNHLIQDLSERYRLLSHECDGEVMKAMIIEQATLVSGLASSTSHDFTWLYEDTATWYPWAKVSWLLAAYRVFQDHTDSNGDPIASLTNWRRLAKKQCSLIKTSLPQNPDLPSSVTAKLFTTVIDDLCLEHRKFLNPSRISFECEYRRRGTGQGGSPKLALVFSPEFLMVYHLDHHECRERLYAITSRFEKIVEDPDHPLFETDFYSPPVASHTDLTSPIAGTPGVHDPEYVTQIQKDLDLHRPASPHQRLEGNFLPSDSRPGHWEAALRSVGALKQAVDLVDSTQERVVACINRPPGHLAGNRICLFNNVAVGVRYFQSKVYAKEKRLPRVLVVDLDAHHGRHLQQVFYADPSVTYFSIHQNNVHPGSGWVEEIGEATIDSTSVSSSLGSSVNIPIDPGTYASTYSDILNRELSAVVKRLKPAAIFVALGVDGDWREPFASLELDSLCFYQAGRLLRELRPTPQTPIIAALEGGFSVVDGGNADGIEAFLLGAASDTPFPERLNRRPPHPRVIRNAGWNGDTPFHVITTKAPIRSLICDAFQTSEVKRAYLHGDIQTILGSNCSEEDLLTEPQLQSIDFGIGAASPEFERHRAIEDVGESITVCGQHFVQSPSQQVPKDARNIWTPFCAGWSDVPHLWLQLRFNASATWHDVLKLVQRAMRVNVELFGICGIVEVAPRGLFEKRLLVSPSIISKARIQGRMPNSPLSVPASTLPWIVQPPMHDQFFASTNGENEQSRPLVVCGLVVPTPLSTSRALSTTMQKAFYRSPRSNPTSNDFRSHTHALIPEPTSIDWERISGTGLETMKRLSDPARVHMVTHLEDSTRIQQAYLGIRFLHAPKEL